MTSARRAVRAALLAALVACLAAHPATAAPITKPRWVAHTRVTEYFPVPERWFVGARVGAVGLDGLHRIDWLYGARGLSMEGDGIGLDGCRYHIEALGSAGWINAAGKRTRPGRRGWSEGAPFWRSVSYWRNRAGRPTFPLEAGGWLDGEGRSYRPVGDVTFAPGPSKALTYYASVAVDPDLIPLGSQVYVPAYRTLTPSRGWFTAADTGGAIRGRHLDVFRPPPGSAKDAGRLFAAERVFVVPPTAAR